MNVRNLIVVGASLVLISACGDDVPEETTNHTHASATLLDKAGLSFGTATFEQEEGSSTVKIDISLSTTSTHATAGDHAMHIHASPACDAPAFTSAMGHWNPTTMDHGNPTASPHHGGDLGNVTINSSRSATKHLESTEMALTEGEAKSIIGLPVIVHANVDDFVTQMPPGNAGARVACGRIQLVTDEH